LGGILIFDAALRTDRFGIGAFAIIVDAKDDRVVTFYQSNGFVLILGQSRRLFVPVATVLRAGAMRRTSRVDLRSLHRLLGSRATQA